MGIIETIIEQQGADSTTVQVLRQFFPIIEQAWKQDAESGKEKDAEIRKLRSLVSEMSENDTYETEYDGRMYSICHGCGAQDGEDHRSADCLYVRAQAAMLRLDWRSERRRQGNQRIKT